MLHIMKLAVKIRDIAHLRQVQANRAATHPPLRHHTRNMPRRRDEIAGQGSIYWVVAGTLLVRQPIKAIIEDTWDDGSRCTALILDPALTQVEGRPVKAFQGWRYLEHTDIPKDLSSHDLAPAAMPAALRNELRALCLL